MDDKLMYIPTIITIIGWKIGQLAKERDNKTERISVILFTVQCPLSIWLYVQK